MVRHEITRLLLIRSMAKSNQRQWVFIFAMTALLIGVIPVRAQDGATRPAITPGNAAEVTRLALLGRGWLHDVGWSPDGQTLALVGSAGVWFYGANDLDAPPRLLETGFSTWTVAYSPDGKRLAAGGRDSMVRVWDTGTFAGDDVIDADPLHEFLCRPGQMWGAVESVAFSPDGTLLTCASDGVVVFDVETGAQVAVLSVDGVVQGGNGAVFSPDGTVLVTSGQRGEVQLWNTQTFELLDSWRLRDDQWPRSIAYSPDGALVAFAVIGEIQVRDAATGERLASLSYPPAHFFSLDFGPDKTLVAVGSFGLILWDVETGEQLDLLAGADWSESYSADSDAGWEPFPEYQDMIGVAYSPDRQHLAAVDATGQCYVWNAHTGERLVTLGGYSMGGAARGGASSDWINITALAFAPDGKTLAAGTGGYITSGGWVELWDIDERRVRGRLPGGGAIEGVAYSPDGALLATSSALSGVRLWDAATGEVLIELGPVSEMPERVGFSPDGTQLALDMFWKLYVWDVATGEPLVDVETGEAGADYALGVAYSPDGALLATGGQDSTIALWDPATGELLLVVEGPESSIFDIAFSPAPLADGTGRWLLASAAGWTDGMAWLWAVQHDDDTVSAAELAVLEGGIRRVAFSPDGALLATGTEDGRAQLWDTATYELLAEFEGHAEWITSLAFSADGTLLATGGWDGTIRLWGIPDVN